LQIKPLIGFPVDRDRRRKNPGYKAQCKACANERAKLWNAANPDRVRSNSSAWLKLNRWRFNATMAAVNKRRSAEKKKRLPAWYDHQRVREIYEFAAEFREAGFDVDVDHIVPLQGKLVCGLHWHGNLRVCLASVNEDKLSTCAVSSTIGALTM